MGAVQVQNLAGGTTGGTVGSPACDADLESGSWSLQLP